VATTDGDSMRRVVPSPIPRRIFGFEMIEALLERPRDARGAARRRLPRRLDGPKVQAACTCVEQTGGFAVIGSMADTGALLHGEAGTTIALSPTGAKVEVGSR
jgi:carbamate kinase